MRIKHPSSWHLGSETSYMSSSVTSIHIVKWTSLRAENNGLKYVACMFRIRGSDPTSDLFSL